MVEDAPDTWSIRRFGGEACGVAVPVDAAFVAIAGDRPASRLLSPIATSQRFSLLARTRGAPASGPSAGAALHTVAIVVAVPDPIAYAVVDDPLGEKVVAPDGTITVLPGDPDGWRAAIAAIRAKDPVATFVLAPRETWTVQDLVARCALLGGDPAEACVIGDPSPREVKAEAGGGLAAQAFMPPAFKDVVARNTGQLRYCYETRLKANPDLGGRVEVRWVLNGGAVASANVVANTTGDRPFADCIAVRANRWTFPADLTGEFTAPFVFHSAQ